MDRNRRRSRDPGFQGALSLPVQTICTWNPTRRNFILPILCCSFRYHISYLICLEGSAGGSWTEFGLEWRSAWGPGPASWWSPESPFCFWSAWAMMLATLSLSTWSGNELDKYNVKWWYFNQRLNWLSLFENLVELWNFHTRWKLNQQICTREIFKMQKFFSGKSGKTNLACGIIESVTKMPDSLKF